MGNKLYEAHIRSRQDRICVSYILIRILTGEFFLRIVRRLPDCMHHLF